MTILEAVKAKVRPYPIQHTSIEVVSIDEGVNINEEYSQQRKSVVNRVVIQLLKQLLSTASISQSGASLSFDTDALKNRISTLMQEEGLDASNYVDNKVTRVW